MTSISSFYTFYVIDRFGVSVQDAQILLFVFRVPLPSAPLLAGR